MGKNGLFIMSIGFITITCSALGKNMTISYPVMTTGLFLVGVGYFISKREKTKEENNLNRGNVKKCKSFKN